MEYVVYLSRTKIDMLYEQVGKKPFNYSVGGQLEFGPVKLEANKNGDTEKNYYQKLEKVISEISTVSSIFDENADYITGTMSMYWGTLKHTESATFWVGQEDNGVCKTKILLIGSGQHIIGNNPDAVGIHCSPLACFLNAYHKELEFNQHLDKVAQLHNESNIRYIVSTMETECKHDKLQILCPYKFLAKCLSQEYRTYDDGSAENLIIATPLYVSSV